MNEVSPVSPRRANGIRGMAFMHNDGFEARYHCSPSQGVPSALNVSWNIAARR
jgi:hypothetical protein